MHSHGPGLVLPSRLCLATADQDGIPLHPDYDPSLDSVAKHLASRGFRIEREIRGDLPLGWGFASSTILGALHLAQLSAPERTEALLSVDQSLQGFAPSGVDQAYCVHRTAGLFGHGSWTSVDVETPEAAAFLLPGARPLSPTLIRERMARHFDGLARLARSLAADTMATGKIEYEQLFDYCGRLLGAGVYTPEAAALVEDLLGRGTCCKAIGSLHGKALVVLDRSLQYEGTNGLRRLAGEHSATIIGDLCPGASFG